MPPYSGFRSRNLSFCRFQRSSGVSAAARSSSSCCAEIAPRWAVSGNAYDVLLRSPVLPGVDYQRLCGTSFALALLQQSLRGATALCASLICAMASSRCSCNREYPSSPALHLLEQTGLLSPNGVDTPGNFAGDIHFRRFNGPLLTAKPSGTPAGRNSHHARRQPPPVPRQPTTPDGAYSYHNRPAIIPVSNRRVLQLPPTMFSGFFHPG